MTRSYSVSLIASRVPIGTANLSCMYLGARISSSGTIRYRAIYRTSMGRNCRDFPFPSDGGVN